jgi:hypothetical protein
MEAVRTSETSVNSSEPTRLYILRDSYLVKVWSFGRSFEGLNPYRNLAFMELK